jgi:hypothetical protein
LADNSDIVDGLSTFHFEIVGHANG